MSTNPRTTSTVAFGACASRNVAPGTSPRSPRSRRTRAPGRSRARAEVLQRVARGLAGREPAELGADGSSRSAPASRGAVGDSWLDATRVSGERLPSPITTSRATNCPRCGRTPARATRRRCCRSSRRPCIGRPSRGRGRTADRPRRGGVQPRMHGTRAAPSSVCASASTGPISGGSRLRSRTRPGPIALPAMEVRHHGR